MGIDRYFAEFLGGASKAGVDFSRTATLGRLNLFVDQRSLAAVLRDNCGGASDDEVRAVRTAGGGYAEEFLRRLGALQTTSIDASTYEGATLVHDMNVPIGDDLKRKFSVVIDGGTLEHIFNFPVAIANCMQMLDVGGHFFSHTMANNFMGHGFYQFCPELFYRVFAPENGFRVRRVVIFEQRIGRPRWYEAADPKDIGDRVELINRRPTYLFVHAERIADVPPFAVPPQQTDYADHWSRNEAPHYGVEGLRTRVYEWARTHNDFFLRYSPGPVYDLALSMLVRGLPRRGFRRGQFTPLRSLKK
jgi:hypothetical protein